MTIPRCTLALALALPGPATAARAPSAVPPPASCAQAVAAAERSVGTPKGLLSTIALVESGRLDPVLGRAVPWAWTINAQGVGHAYVTKSDAVAAAATLQALGVRSIDVGCMQVNLAYHPDAFATLDQAFDPSANTEYAAHFLLALFHQTGSWPEAAAAYHSQTPDIGADYGRRVMALWSPAPPDSGTTGSRPAEDGNRLPGFASWLQQNAREASTLAAASHPRAGPLAGADGARPARAAFTAGRREGSAAAGTRPVCFICQAVPKPAG